MSDVETLAERVRTVERAVTDGDHTFPAVDNIAELTERIDALEQQIAELDDRATELEGATQALRGYVGNVRSVNERVEQRADTALAATERLERRLDDSEQALEESCAQIEKTTRTDEFDGRRREPPEPPDIGTTSADGETNEAVESDGAGDSGILERIRSRL